MNATFLKIASSLAALSLLLLHQFYPAITIDAISLGLLVLVVLPWLLSYVKGLEVAGVKIDLHDLMSATEKVDLKIEPATAHVKLKGHPPSVQVQPTDESQAALQSISETHPNLALVQFRIQIELRIRALAQSKNLLNARVPLNRMIRALVASDVIDSRTGSGLLEIVALGNQAAHNADVSPEAARWVLDVGNDILLQLDAILAAEDDAGS